MRSLLIRVSVLAVVRNHVHSSVEVHRVDALAAVDGVYPRVIVSVDHVSANSGAYLVGASLSRGRVVAAVTLHSLATVEGPTGAARERIVARVTADAVYAARAREVVVAATTSDVVRTVGADEGVSSGGAIEGSG